MSRKADPVDFYARDAEVSARFSRESFGFTETFRRPGQPALLSCGLATATAA
jgi:hypothetical protein